MDTALQQIKPAIGAWSCSTINHPDTMKHLDRFLSALKAANVQIVQGVFQGRLRAHARRPNCGSDGTLDQPPHGLAPLARKKLI